MQVESVIYHNYNSYSDLFLEFVEVNQLDSRNQDSRPIAMVPKKRSIIIQGK